MFYFATILAAVMSHNYISQQPPVNQSMLFLEFFLLMKFFFEVALSFHLLNYDSC